MTGPGFRPTSWTRPIPGTVRESFGPGGITRYEFPGTEIIVPKPPPYRTTPWKEPWRPTPPDQRQSEIMRRIAERRAADEARRQAEQAQARERAQREAREMAARQMRERQAQEARERAISGAKKQAEIMERERAARATDQRFRETLERQRRLEFEMQRNNSKRQGIGAWLGTALAGMVPPEIRAYAIRRPSEVIDSSMSGPGLIEKEANRIAWQTNYAMENFSFWVTQVATIVAGGLGAAGDIGASTSMIKALLSTARLPRVPISVAGVMPAKSIDQVLMGCRNEATQLTRRLVAQELARGIQIDPGEFGDISHGILRALVLKAKEDGLLPKTIRVAPAPAKLTGVISRQPAIDVWDASTCIGWDLTTATVRQVAGHERYLNRIMPDGTRIRDVRPLVYRR